MVKMNLAALRDLAKNYPVIYSLLRKKLKAKMESICYDPENDMLLLNTGQEIRIETLLEQHLDKTGAEAYWNKISLDGCIPFVTKRNCMKVLVCGLQLCAEYLTGRFPSLRFVLVGSTDDKYASLRFHLLRNDETWVSDTLEDYQQPVMRIDI